MTAQRTILITGATDGLGRRTAEKLASPDVLLLVHGRNPTRGRAVVEGIEAASGSATFY
jgi:NAD(P)-dependent dehydrogenase (short-subunit alcohol dehydrogenase family)